eukprot:3600343-Amphidinium_carterae.1
MSTFAIGSIRRHSWRRVTRMGGDADDPMLERPLQGTPKNLVPRRGLGPSTLVEETKPPPPWHKGALRSPTQQSF